MPLLAAKLKPLDLKTQHHKCLNHDGKNKSQHQQHQALLLTVDIGK
jgi:hypothetical protein